MLTTSSQTDPLLIPFLAATDDVEEAFLLARLITEHVDPVIREVLRYKLRFDAGRDGVRFQNPDVEEIQGEIRLHLLKRLRDLKRSPSDRPVNNLRSYAATVARNGCDEYLRRKYPRRRQLKDKVRYCLTNTPKFALWEDAESGLMCGLAAWKSGAAPSFQHLKPEAKERVEELCDRLRDIDAGRLAIRDLITAIFEASGGMLELDCLTGVMTRLLGIEDLPEESLDEHDNFTALRPGDRDARPDMMIEQRQILEHLWGEICLLSRPQRIALLLNLRSPQGINIITLFPLTRVATFEQIAEALEIPAKPFEELCAKLPMDDQSIAQFLGVTRQQVINLRRSARDRLDRRIRAVRKGRA